MTARIKNPFSFSVLLAVAIILDAALLPVSSVRAADMAPSYITSWNVCSRQFIDAPVFRVLPLAGTAEYRAVVPLGGGKSLTVSSKSPSLSLETIWPQMKNGFFSLTLECVDRDGKVLRTETSTRVKAPDFEGFNEPAADWAAAADRNIAHLITANEKEVVFYREPGVPVWVWAATPQKHESYPCITLNHLTWAFLGHVENHGPQSEEAMRLARVGMDWALEHRHPESGALPLFPYSTISQGKYGGNVEGSAVNLVRASSLASSYVDIYKVTKHQPYLDYARHIANTTVKLQNADGSFPYRVNPETGAVVEQYTCGCIEFIELVENLEHFGYDERLAMAAHRALDWMLTSVCTSHNWKATFEDVREMRFYSNLSQMPAHLLVRYLCRHKEEDPGYLRTAIELNRWIEDQFVAFGPDDAASPIRVKGPLVFEQFVCWRPMEAHTGNWILTLIELHRATGKQIYLDKAKAAANAICHDQYPDGQFSTWGRDCDTGAVFGKDYITGHSHVREKDDQLRLNWFNCNAMADQALYKLTLYVKELKK